MNDTPFATASDVTVRWRPLSASETATAETLCGDASDIIRARFPDIDDRILAGAPTVRTATRIVATMVKRAMLVGDAEGLSAQNQVAGPFQMQNTFANPNGNLFLTAEDVRALEGETARVLNGWLG